MRFKYELHIDNPKLEKKLSDLGFTFFTMDSPIVRFSKLNFYEEDERCSLVLNLVKEYNLNIIRGIEYEKEDYKKSDWFILDVREINVYPQPESFFKYLETTYDLAEYCPTCGIGKKQKKSFYIKELPKKLKYNLFSLQWIFDQNFIDKVVQEKFISERISGIKYEPFYKYKSGELIDNYYQLKVENTLSSGFKTNLFPVTCKYRNEEEIDLTESWRNSKDEPFCGRVKYHFPLEQPFIIEKSAFDNSPDIVNSKEWFGSGRDAHKAIIISKKVQQLINENKFSGTKLTPIFHD